MSHADNADSPLTCWQLSGESWKQSAPGGGTTLKTHIYIFLPLISKRVSPPRHYHYELSLAMPRQGTRCDVTGAERVATDMAELILLRCSTQIWSCRDSLASLRRHTEMSAEGRDRFKGEQGGGPYVRYIRSTSAAVNIIKISYSIICFYLIFVSIFILSRDDSNMLWETVATPRLHPTKDTAVSSRGRNTELYKR